MAKDIWVQMPICKVKAFRLSDEPEVIYIVKIREGEYMILYEDGYDQKTGEVEFANATEILEKFNIDIESKK